MHNLADLLDGVGDVRVDERQVLEGSGKAPELSRIRIGGPKVAEILTCVSTGIETGLLSTMPVHSRMSRANWS
jgi:hypothetical protein